MTLAKTLQPPTVSLAENPVRFVVETDNYFSDTGTQAEFFLFLASFPQVGDGFALSYNGATYTFTFVASQGNSPEELPASYTGVGLGTIVAYMLELVWELNRHYRFSNDFTITLEGLQATPYICFLAKYPGENYTITLETGSTAPVSTDPQLNVDGVDSQVHPFYAILFQCFLEGQLVGEDLLSPDAQGEVTCNVSAYLKAHLSSSFTFPHSALLIERTNLLKTFYVRYAERYGTPPVIHKMFSTSGTQTFALPGGVSQMRLDQYARQNIDFFDDLAYHRGFLTWAPKTRTVKPDQLGKQFFLNF